MDKDGSPLKNGSSAVDTRVAESPETDDTANEETENGSGEEPEDPKKQATRLTGELLANPQVLAAFQHKIDSMIGKKSGYIESLPKCVKRRIKALKKLQSNMFDIESKYYEEVHDLECRFATLYTPLFDKRESIINSRIEPTDSDCEWTSDEEEEEQEPPKAKIVEIDETKPLSEQGAAIDDEQTKGVPEFWLTIFKNVDLIAALVQENDEPVLKNLLDIKVQYFPSKEMGFLLEFVFGPNEYFTNPVLTKEYRMNSKPDPDAPLGYEGPEITSCKGCKIDWKADKNVTVRKQKHKMKGTKKTVTKMVKVNSFFNFFTPPQVKEDDEDEDEIKGLLMIDYEIGETLKSQIIPRAVLYFTGEALEDDEDDDEFEDGEEGGDDNDDDNDDEDDDPDYKPPKGSENGPPECKQQ